jgi:ribosomal protein L9
MNVLRPNGTRFSLIRRSYTVIVERYQEPRLVKKGTDPRKFNLKQPDFHYKFVDCLHSKKWGDMQVILTKYIEGIGRQGELLEVPRKLAHTELIPSGFAVYPTKENLELYKDQIEESANKPRLSKFASLTRDYLMDKVFEMQMNISEKWTLNKEFVRIALRYNGVMVDNDSIELPQNYNKICSNGDSINYYMDVFTCTVKINEYITASVRLQIKPADSNKLWETFSMFNKK